MLMNDAFFCTIFPQIEQSLKLLTTSWFVSTFFTYHRLKDINLRTV